MLSIETGVPVVLCVSCSRTGSAPRRSGEPFRPLDLFRSGASLLLLFLLVAGVFALERRGWEGLRRLVLTLLRPEFLFAFVPLALVLGAVAGLVRRLLARKL